MHQRQNLPHGASRANREIGMFRIFGRFAAEWVHSELGHCFRIGWGTVRYELVADGGTSEVARVASSISQAPQKMTGSSRIKENSPNKTRPW